MKASELVFICFKRRSLNHLDSLLLLNMAVINILGIYSLATDQLTPSASSASTLTSVFALQYILIWLHMIVYLWKGSKVRESCLGRWRGHGPRLEEPFIGLRDRAEVDSTILQDRDPESDIERSGNSTLYVLITDDPN